MFSIGLINMKVEVASEWELTVCENTLFHWETLFVISTGNAEDVSLPFIT